VGKFERKAGRRQGKLAAAAVELGRELEAELASWDANGGVEVVRIKVEHQGPDQPPIVHHRTNGDGQDIVMGVGVLLADLAHAIAQEQGAPAGLVFAELVAQLQLQGVHVLAAKGPS